MGDSCGETGFPTVAPVMAAAVLYFCGKWKLEVI